MQRHRRPHFLFSRLSDCVYRRAQPSHRCEFSSSLLVLVALGAIGCFAAPDSHAQAAGTVLPRGTLPVLRGLVAGQAVINAPTATGTGRVLTINQQSTRAIIDWEKFNIANGSEVRFIQPSTVASVLNRIYSADPAIIQGKLSANGQVLLINQNGILFDRGAQINVNALVASTLNITNEAFNRGLTAGGTTTPALQGGYRLDGSGETDPTLSVNGAVRIGASGDVAAAAPLIKANAGGNILVFAPVIDNQSGLITSPDGQVVLAAGSKAYLSDLGADGQGVRGLLVEVSADDGPVNLTSLVRNRGTISADRGNVTLAGLAINQEGRVSASTAVLYDGSIWLKARSVKQGESAGSLVPERAGKIELARGSVTETPLDLSDKTRVSESTPYGSDNRAVDNRGSIRVEGGTIAHRGTLTAPGGRIDIAASDTIDPDRARVYLDDGSVINAAGHWADVDYASNLLNFRVTSNELKNSPLQKNGVLRGQTVTVDLRKSNPILDLSGYLDGRLRGVGEKASGGGDVTLSSTGSVVQRTGASVDVSGGGYVYQGGRVSTSQLLGQDGRNYDISTASKERVYSTVLDKFTRDYDRWGQSAVYDNLNVAQAVSEPGYLEGRPGGKLLLTAPKGIVLDGELKGGATAGATQLSSVPRGGALTIGTNLNFLDTTIPVANVTFSNRATSSLRAGFDVDSVLSDALRDELTLSTATLFPAVPARADAFFDAGRFDSIEINSTGLIRLPAGVTLQPGIESTLTLRGQEIDIGGAIVAPSGTVALQTRTLVNTEPTAQPERITLQPGAKVSTAGLWLNNASTDGSPVGALLPSATSVASGSPASTLNGGSIGLSGASVDLQPGSVLDVSGGGRVARNNALTAGNAGSISISADAGAGVPAASRFGADLLGYALGTGGSLSIALGQLQIGGGVAPDAAYRFDSSLFDQGGFRSFDLSGARGLTVVEDTRIEPMVESWLVDPLDAARLASGGDLATVATRFVKPAHQRTATNVALRARGTTDATVAIEQGASITTQSGGSITIDAIDGIEIDGRLAAPAGAITVALNGRANQPASTLRLGENARLEADGSYIAQPNDLNLRQGSLTGGGVVSLNTVRAKIVTDVGSLISVDGVAQLQDLSTLDPTRPYAATMSYGDAGSVVVKAQDEVELRGTLSGRSPGPRSAGGSFALELTNRDDAENPESTSRARRILVSQAPSQTALDLTKMDAAIDLNALSSGGFDKLRLTAEDRIEFRGRSNLDFARGVRLDAAEFLVANDARVDISSASVVLANSFGRFAVGSTSLNSPEVSQSVATVTGQGTFNVNTQTLDLYGDLTLNGVQKTNLTSQNDLRLTGRAVGGALTSPNGATLTGSLTTPGDLTIQAAQVYPSTQSKFTIAVAERAVAGGAATSVTDGKLIVRSNGNTTGTVYSAGGKLALQADNIQQAGVIKAPLGEIDLNAQSYLELTSASVTSVSAAGSLIPYGSTVAGVSWLYSTTNGTVNVNDLKAAPAKRIALAGAVVDQRSGSTLDVSGGGDLLATEFVPGSGGTTDVLRQDNTYAIIPTAKLAAMPIDSDIAQLQDVGFGLLSARQDRAIYDRLHIGAGSVVPEGDYTLLPGRYALLPGAYLVQLQTGSAYSALPAGSTQSLTNGQTAVAGYRTAAGTQIRESRTVGVVVRPGSAALTESDYNQTRSSFFADLAVKERRQSSALPGDAGAVAVSASDFLRLAGTFNTAPATAGARAAEVDISAERIAVVDRIGQAGIAADYLQVEASTLSNIKGSVLIGGLRSDVGDGVRVNAGATNVLIANSSAQPLQSPEILLAARDTIQVRNGSVLSGTGTTAGRVRDIETDAGGALIRLSNAAQVTVDRGTAPDTALGTIDIEAGTRLQASGSLLIDATKATLSRGDLQVATGGALSLAAGSISLGDPAAGSAIDGLSLSNAQLAQFNALGALSLKSYGAIDLLGAVQVGSATLRQLTLDTAALQGVGTGAPDAVAQVRAGELRLVNTSGSTSSATTAATGNPLLRVDADRIVIGGGSKSVSGFAAVNLDAAGDLTVEGVGSLRAAADLNVKSARIVSQVGANQVWKAVDDSVPDAPLHRPVVLTANVSPANAAEVTALGSRLAIEGQSITSGARISMASGSVSLTAQGTGDGDDVRLVTGALIDVAGGSRNFNGVTVAANAGAVKLSALTGQVAVDTGAAVKLDAATQGGSAGSLDIAARQVLLDGTVTAAAAAGQAGGRIRLDVQTLADFSTLNAKLNEGNFSESRDLRVRQGDVTVASTDTVRARQIVLAADSGRIDIDGQLDAGAVQGGGSVAAYASTGLRVGDTAVIDASGRSTATDSTPSNGGRVQLDTRSGTLAFQAGGRIDVRAGDSGRAGTVSFTAARNDSNDGLDVDLRGTVLSQRRAADAAGEVSVEARRVYESSDTSNIASYEADHLAFMSAVNSAAIQAGIRGDDGAPQANLRVRGAVEVRTSSDFTTTSNWVLTPVTETVTTVDENTGESTTTTTTTGNWLTGGEPGTLTIRAAGDLTVAHALGLPSDDLFDGKTWSLRLAGGADLSAANPLATLRPTELAGKGSVILDGPDAKVRTGTGSIDIAAGRDLTLTDNRAVVYTSGLAAAENPANTSESPNPAGGVNGPWVKDGGSIRISAQQDAVGTSDQWINDWYRRPRGTVANSNQSGWWAYRPNFRQNIASFGGGDIDITAGRNVDNLSAMSPTSGRVTEVDGVARLDVQGGGNVRIEAGNDVLGGEYLVGRGAGVIRAGGKVGVDKDASGAVLKSATQVYLMGESNDPALRQASMRIEATGDVALQSVDNPTILSIARSSGSGVNFGIGSSSSYFYTYSDNSRVDVASLAGDVTLGTAPLLKPAQDGATDSNGSAYAASLSAVAFDGSIRGLVAAEGGSQKSLDLFPSITGTARLLAGRDVSGINLVASDRDPLTVAAWSRVVADSAVTGNLFLAADPSTPRLVSRPATEGFEYDVQALTGSLRESSFTFPAEARLRAGIDITGLSAQLQNLAATDLSVVQADTGDIRPTGGIAIGGPGKLLVQAGRNIDLQTPLTASGNANNQSLTTANSARLTVVAGVDGNLDLSKLDAAYAELIEAGKKQDNTRAEAAMKVFFGNATVTKGDISSYLTSIQTFGGSDIDLLAPKGNITVGLTTPNAATVGAVTNAGGAIRSYLEGNFNINQGKLVTAQGGDVLIYTSKGNIDAGRGAKTSVTTPAPQRVPITDNDGVIVGYRFVLPAGVSGSGIQTITSDPDGPGPLAAPSAGSVFLFAPSGFVDAGEAGIVSGANIFIAAQVVLNASNISSAGTSVGVPVAVAGSLASSLASGGTTNTSKAAEDAAASASNAARGAASADGLQKPTILTVEVLGFGEKNCKEQQKDCFAK